MNSAGQRPCCKLRRTLRSAKVWPRLVRARVKFRFLEPVSAPRGIRFGFQFSFPVRVQPLTKTCARPSPRAAHARREARARALASSPPAAVAVVPGAVERARGHRRLGRPAEPRRHEVRASPPSFSQVLRPPLFETVVALVFVPRAALRPFQGTRPPRGAAGRLCLGRSPESRPGRRRPKSGGPRRWQKGRCPGVPTSSRGL